MASISFRLHFALDKDFDKYVKKAINYNMEMYNKTAKQIGKELGDFVEKITQDATRKGGK